MITKEWWTRNAGGLIFSLVVVGLLSAASEYITKKVKTETDKLSEELKNYVPLKVWSQWAQERGEWRGAVDNQLKTHSIELVRSRDELQREMTQLRSEVQAQIATIDKKQEVQTATLGAKLDAQIELLKELREALKSHVQQIQKTPP